MKIGCEVTKCIARIICQVGLRGRQSMHSSEGNLASTSVIKNGLQEIAEHQKFVMINSI